MLAEPLYLTVTFILWACTAHCINIRWILYYYCLQVALFILDTQAIFKKLLHFIIYSWCSHISAVIGQEAGYALASPSLGYLLLIYIILSYSHYITANVTHKECWNRSDHWLVKYSSYSIILAYFRASWCYTFYPWPMYNTQHWWI